jgi:hypothetical protein
MSMSALPQLPSNLGSQAQSLANEGQSLYDAANKAAEGDYSGIAAAASALVADLPPGGVQRAVSAVAAIGEGALAGASLGSVIPGWGTAIGAAVGAIAGAISSIASGPPPTMQNDVRSSGEQYVAPAVPNGSPYSVIPFTPGWNPRIWNDVVGRPLAFFLLPTQQSYAIQVFNPWTFDFTFSTSWFRPPKATDSSKQAAWNLAIWSLGEGMVAQAWALNPKKNPGYPADISGMKQAIAQAQITAGTVLGGDNIAARARAYAERWYGTAFDASPGILDPTINTKWGGPGPNVSASQRDAAALLFSVGDIIFTFATSTSAGAFPIERMINKTLTASQVASVVQAWRTSPLDFLYYPLPVSVSGYVNAVSLARPTPGQAPNAFAMVADTTCLSYYELGALVASGAFGEVSQTQSDTIALHFSLARMWMRDRGNRLDSVKYGPPFYSTFPNEARIVGRLNRLVRAGSTSPSVVSGSASPPAPPATQQTPTSSAQGPSRLGSAPVVIAAGGVGLGLLKLLSHLPTKKRR